METFNQTLQIPDNRQITLTLPDSIPTGEAEMVLVIHPKSSTAVRKEDELLKLVGILKDSPNFGGILYKYKDGCEMNEMNKFLLDTNIILGILNGHQIVRTFFLSKLLGQPCFVSEINPIELLGYPSITVIEESAIHVFLDFVKILPMNRAVANRVIQLRRLTTRLKLPDAIVAATAIEHHLILVSGDEVFTKISLAELNVLNPYEILH